MLAIRPLAVALVLMIAGEASAAERWAVIAAPALRGDPLPEAVDAALAEAGRALVDRSALEQVADEASLAATLGERLRLGRMVGADRLVLLRPDEAGVTLVTIADVGTGVRLKQLAVPAADPARASAMIVGAAADVAHRFEAGVTTALAVTPFLSQDLTRDHEALQTALPAILTQALEGASGVAVLEIDEARQLGEERDRPVEPHEVAQALVPVFVEGTYSTRRTEDGHVEVALTLRIARADGRAAELRTTTPLGDVAALVAGPWAEEILAVANAGLNADAAPHLSPQQLYAALVRRAETFAEVGLWDQAMALREAALLAEPDNDGAAKQREAIVYESVRHLDTKLRAKGPYRASNEAYRRELSERAELYRRALDHMAWLIRNRAMPLQQAVGLTRTALNARRIDEYGHAGDAARVAADARGRFIDDVLPDLPTLGGRVGYVAAEAAALALDHADWPRRVHLLRERLAADTPLAGQWLYDLTHGYHRRSLEDAKKRASSDRAISAEAFEQTMRDLASSDRESVRIAGELGLLCIEEAKWNISRRKVGVDEMRRWVEQTRALDARAKAARQTESDGLRMHIGHIRQRLEGYLAAMERPSPPKPPSAIAASENPTRAERQAAALGRLRLEEIHIDVVKSKVPHRRDGEPTLATMRWWAAGGMGDVRDLLAVPDDGRGGKMDVWWAPGAVLMDRTGARAEEVLLLPDDRVTDVCWDGRYLWVAGAHQGLRVLDADGNSIEHVDAGAGLPPSDRSLFVEPLEPGVVAAVGTSSDDNRSWAAIVRVGAGGRPAVDVVHRAMRAVRWSEEDAFKRAGLDPASAVPYEWTKVVTFPTRNTPYLFIGRDRLQPIAINLEASEAHSVGELPGAPGVANPFYATRGARSESFVLLPEGESSVLLLVAYSSGASLYRIAGLPESGLSFSRLSEWKQGDVVHSSNADQAWLDAVGPVKFLSAGARHGGPWVELRIEGTDLVADPVTAAPLLMHYRAAPSAFHGYIAWGIDGERGGKLYRASVGEAP